MILYPEAKREQARSELPTIYTIGHSTRSVLELVELLEQVSVDLLVDVRSLPRSRANPQFNIETFPGALAAAGIGYRHWAALGGFARPAPARGTLAQHPVAQRFLSQLRRLRRDRCVSSGPRRTRLACRRSLLRGHLRRGRLVARHRRIIADYLLMQGIAVAHIMGPGNIDPPMLTPGAQPLPDGQIVYPAS